ncbi:MAG: hypothetical protein FWF36_03300 [Propionibacteriaceae bacterium]|nr:hypothetical protein [Propionibacteriaceae bacterium]
MRRRLAERAQAESVPESQVVRDAILAYLQRPVVEPGDTVHRFFTTTQEVADAVRQQRARLRLSRSTLATKAGVTAQVVADLEDGSPEVSTEDELAALGAVNIDAMALPGRPPSALRPEPIDLDAHLAAYLTGDFL